MYYQIQRNKSEFIGLGSLGLECEATFRNITTLCYRLHDFKSPIQGSYLWLLLLLSVPSRTDPSTWGFRRRR